MPMKLYAIVQGFQIPFATRLCGILNPSGTHYQSALHHKINPREGRAYRYI
ncbi:protein of unknown function [Shinella sp. WSC3-e]|nr:protein of unknown function [Shinella sp. WSC3-e]